MSEYNGTYKAFVPKIVELHNVGYDPYQICEALRQSPERAPLYSYDYRDYPSFEMVKYILRRIGCMSSEGQAPAPAPYLRQYAAAILKRSGMKIREIAHVMGISNSRAQQLVARGEERDRKLRRRLTLPQYSPTSRPIDMGGPRGEWQTWTPADQWAELKDSHQEAS